MRDWQKNHEAWHRRRIACSDKTGRTILPRLAVRPAFVMPKIVVPDDEAGFRRRKGHVLFHRPVERVVTTVHFGALDGVDDHGSGRRSPVCSTRRRNQPVVMIGRHENQLAPPMPRDLDRRALRLVLEVANLPLKFQRRRSRHRLKSTIIQIIRIIWI